jgi:hypothetical protein
MDQACRLGVGTLILGIGTLVLGCRPWLPVHRVDHAIDPRTLGREVRSFTGPITGTEPASYGADAVPLPPLPLQPVSEQEALGPSQTPLLDAALARAQALQDATITEPSQPADPDSPQPVDSPPTAATSAPDDPPPMPDVAGPPPVEAIEPAEDNTADDPPAAESPPPAKEATTAEAAPPAETADAPVLEVAELRICRKVFGFGRFEPVEGDTCQSGGSLLLYCEMQGLSYEPAGEAAVGPYRSRLDSTVEIREPTGLEPVWSQHLGAAEDVCRRPRHDYYVNYRLTLPNADTLPPGAYRLRIVQQDALTGAEARREVPIRILSKDR